MLRALNEEMKEPFSVSVDDGVKVTATVSFFEEEINSECAGSSDKIKRLLFGTHKFDETAMAITVFLPTSKTWALRPSTT